MADARKLCEAFQSGHRGEYAACFLNVRPGISGPMQEEDWAIHAGRILNRIVAKPIETSLASTPKHQQFSAGNEVTPISSKRCRTVFSILSNTASTIIASGRTPQLCTARKTAAAPIDCP